jgi:hypothetical protein
MNQKDTGYRYNIAKAFGLWRDWLEESDYIEANAPAMMLFDIFQRRIILKWPLLWALPLMQM